MALSSPGDQKECRRLIEEIITLRAPARASHLATALMSRFGSLGAILAANESDRSDILSREPKLNHLFDLVHRALVQALRVEAMSGPILGTHQALADYLTLQMAFGPVEQLRILFLNVRNELVLDEIAGTGSVRQVHAYPSEILRRALQVRATALILVHNHPSGNPRPSRQDHLLTKTIVEGAAIFDIMVHDHLIVSRSGSFSFRAKGLL